MSVLDLGSGAGNLSALFASQGCQLWCTDFSAETLAQARAKLPSAHFLPLQVSGCAGVYRISPAS